MNTKQLREIMRLFTQHGLTTLTITEGENSIHMAREGFLPCPAPVPAAAPAAPSLAEKPAANDPGPDFNQLFEVTSPMVGVFYAAPAPGAQPFVKVGDQVKKGDVLCIVEAMKLNNEITAQRDGEIVDICVKDGDVVEFGQTLMKLY